MLEFGKQIFINIIGNKSTTQRKQRDFKGESISKHITDYCVVDLETTDRFISCAEIIEISALKVRNNQVIEEFSTLVNPHCHIPAEATACNHITDDMVSRAPSLVDVIDPFLAFVQNDVILGYNNASYDMNLLYDSISDLKQIPFRNNYLDLLYACKRSINGLDNYRLETICKHYAIDTEGEHRALKDCYLTKACYDRLYAEYGDDAFRKHKGTSSPRGFQFSSDTLALQEMNRLLEGILKDGVITVEEVNSLQYWLEEHRDLSGNYPFDRVFNALDDVLEDGQITQTELEELKNIFSEIIDPVKNKKYQDKISSLIEKHICLTGEFDFGSKSKVEALICRAGGIIDNSVKKSTDYLVVGAQGSDAWKTGNYGGKIQKAMEYNAKGTTIKIVEELDFIPRVEYLIDHPEENVIEDKEDLSSDCSSSAWKDAIQTMLSEMIKEKELPNQSLALVTNYGRDGKKVTSYSVCIYESENPFTIDIEKDPKLSTTVINMKLTKDKLELVLSNDVFGEIGEKPLNAETKTMSSDEKNIHVLFSMDDHSVVEYIKKITEYELEHYESKAGSFGCCSRYIECSDAMHCIHVNKLYSKACMYRKNLESGRIFYGKNKNIN